MHALSIPTWIIHVSSVIEWILAIWLIWIYGELTHNRAWWAFSLAMLPALISAMCACTWHFFDNAESLEWLVTLQATMTLVGNFTFLGAGWLLWRSSKGKRQETGDRTIHFSSFILYPLSFVLPFGEAFTLHLSKDALFALSLFPYLGFLWLVTRSQQMPKLALMGFYCTLVFVGVTIPAGIYAQVHYGKSLANVDWLHGSAESFLTLANILIVLGFRQAVKEARSQE